MLSSLETYVAASPKEAYPVGHHHQLRKRCLAGTEEVHFTPTDV